ELLAEGEGREALARLHHVRGASARPHPHNQVDVIRLESQCQYLPPLLGALPFEHLPAACRHGPHEHRRAAAWTPEARGEEELDAVVIALLRVCLFHGLYSTAEKTNRPGGGSTAEAAVRLTAWGKTQRLAAGSSPILSFPRYSIPARTERISW